VDPGSVRECCAGRFWAVIAAMQPMRAPPERGLLSIRGADRTMRVAWPVAELSAVPASGISRRSVEWRPPNLRSTRGKRGIECTR
jgi:hypothetical protein